MYRPYSERSGIVIFATKDIVLIATTMQYIIFAYFYSPQKPIRCCVSTCIARNNGAMVCESSANGAPIPIYLRCVFLCVSYTRDTGGIMFIAFLMHVRYYDIASGYKRKRFQNHVDMHVDIRVSYEAN